MFYICSQLLKKNYKEMKRILCVVLVTIFVGVTAISYGQNKLKIAHINSNELLEKMPGRDSAKTKLEKYAKEHKSGCGFLPAT